MGRIYIQSTFLGSLSPCGLEIRECYSEENETGEGWLKASDGLCNGSGLFGIKIYVYIDFLPRVMKKIKLSLDQIEKIKEEAIEGHKQKGREDVKYGLLIIAGLAIYIYLYEKVGVFGIVTIFVVTITALLIVTVVLRKFKG